MKILYYGGQKSGKSLLAEQKSKQLSSKVYYIATYDNSYEDIDMQNRISSHKARRDTSYITIEESINIADKISPNNTYLIDCMSMWIMNMMIKDKTNDIKSTIQKLSTIDANIIFVLNDVGNGVIPIDSFSREYVDISGIVSQELAKICDEVYLVSCGLGMRLK